MRKFALSFIPTQDAFTDNESAVGNSPNRRLSDLASSSSRYKSLHGNRLGISKVTLISRSRTAGATASIIELLDIPRGIVRALQYWQRVERLQYWYRLVPSAVDAPPPVPKSPCGRRRVKTTELDRG
ncbi:hypothetical protein EVAR_58761_1 [Eumeta japonica]|uniref:Uncharacterized protein n=1 Tax=Eumeta variegata TaxID=151549 RepID=A0A4C1ZD89_EUMVA|nr:hypothetical protein EVAR_58761_1 [Eumeta japonica]